MAYNKTKNAEAAQKFLHQGKTAQAIAEYQNILKHEPKDQVTLMTVGDLYVRQGETFQALEYFERLAQLFLADGFVTKAIAIYKKIAKLAPEENRPVERLAELYIQQGILSEARPIYLQLSEMHQRAGRHPQAAALLRKLLDAEPENLRVLTQLAELSQAMGQPAEAAAAHRAIAEQLHRRGDNAEAIKYADRALQVDPHDESTLMLKATALSASGKREGAIELLKAMPLLESGGTIADQLLDLYLEGGDREAACELVTKIFGHDRKHFAPAHRVATALLEAGEPDRALLLIDMIREAMTDGGEQEALSQSLIRAAERLPKQVEPREWLVELYGRTSDSFRMTDALADLAAVCEAAGKHERAHEIYEQLLDRDPENESARRKHASMKTRGDAGSTPAGAAKNANSGGENIRSAPHHVDANKPSSGPAPAQSAPHSSSTEQPLDEETQHFVTQSLTDVDLFSSYGLTQKAIDLLEVVLQRAPRHTASIERLLDLYLGAGNERRTAELATQLQEIYIQRGDPTSADRFAELRRRYERAAGVTSEQTITASQVAPPEFSVPMVEAEAIPEVEPPANAAGTLGPVENFTTVEPGVHEVDLSDEWAALAGILNDAPSEPRESAPETVAAPPPPLAASAQPEPTEFAVPALESATEQEAEAAHAQITESPAPIEALPTVAEEITPTGAQEWALELEPVPTENGSGAAALDSAGFFDSFADDLDALLPTLDAAKLPGEASNGHAERVPAPMEANAPQLEFAQTSSEQASANSTQTSGPLGDVFDQFRADMGENSGEDEDLETHYNLGIAYREMGLVEESISEFQKVAKANKQGHPFRYSMQCCTLLGLAFMDKGQAGIAAMWYERALETPGLDQESILALRYDLGVAQELAGETAAARKSFSQVYGMNIDYRDVAERLGALGKGS